MPNLPIPDRLQWVQERIRSAAQIADRDPAGVELVAVSKGQPVESIREALAAGQRVFGENYLEEAVSKMETIGAGAEWHMTGHVQSRKASTVATRFSTVHSVDSQALAERLSRHAVEHGRRIVLYLECNVSGEGSKFGFPASDPARWKDLYPIWREISGMPGLQVAGLMTMAPYAAGPQITRTVFRTLRELRDASRLHAGFETLSGLSMGMSDDYEAAVEEGATVVRIGRAIFGPRPALPPR